MFCKILAGKIPVKLIAGSKYAVAFKDVKPSAKLHVLIIPKKHINNVLTINKKDSQILYEMYDLGEKLVNKYKLKKFRFIINGGKYLEVNHLHLHLLAGKLTDWAKKDLINDN